MEESLCQSQESWNIFGKLLKEELLTGFSPREGFFLGCEPTFGVHCFIYSGLSIKIGRLVPWGSRLAILEESSFPFEGRHEGELVTRPWRVCYTINFAFYNV